MLKEEGLKKWVDIEKFYFLQLKKYSDNPQSTTKVKQLNSEFKKIQDLFMKYLENLDKSIIPIDGFMDFLNKKEPPYTDYFINFNYTNTIRAYVDNDQVVDIHGQLGDPDNPIIFGYGDEHDEIYSTLENYDDAEYLRFMKYPKYTISNNFARLQTAISVSKYKVHIIGHSCGLSDRTLLREIIDTEKCSKVFIHHYRDRDDFEEKSLNLTRHFREKIDAPKKIAHYDPKRLCPQKK